MNDRAYIYGDDSRLLGETIANQERAGAFLEIGVGNGGNLRIANKLFRLVVGTDIIDLKKLKKEFPFAEIVISDRATCFRSEVFDLVAFNPPYVPSSELLDKSLDGGPNGLEVPLLFLESALNVVKKDGKIVMLVSDEGKISLLVDYCSQNSLSICKVSEKKMFFENLLVFEISSKRSG